MGGVVPTAVILAVVGRREDAGVASALAAVVLAYGVAVLGLAGYGLAGTGPGQERAAVAAAGATMGGLVILAVSVVAVVCVGLLFWLGARELIDQTITAIGEAFVDAVTG